MYFSQPDGVKTHYDVWDIGLNTGRDVLFLHGNLGSNRWWLPFLSHLPQLRENTSRAILAEWRGCGLSDAPEAEDQLHPKGMAADMARLVDFVCGTRDRVDVIGHSTGGIIGVCLAILHPEKISRLILIDTVGPRGVKFEPDFLEIFDTMKTNRDVLAQVLLGTVYGVDTKTPFFSSLVDDASQMASLNWRGVLSQLTDIDLTAELKKVRCPTLILQGEHDQVCPMEGAQVYREILPQSQLTVLHGRGHCPIVEDAGTIAQLVVDFLRS